MLVDAVIASALLVGAVIGLGADVGAAEGFRQSDAVAYALAVLGILPYYLRSRFPFSVLVAASVPVVVLIVLGYSTAALGAGLFILAFTVASRCPPRLTAAAAGYVGVVLVVIEVRVPDRLSVAELVTNVALFAGSFLLGLWARDRRRYVGWMEERAALLERDRELAAQRAVAEERVRIAQELHDIVAHSLGVIAVQAGVGAHVLDDQPEEARRALLAIATTSRDSLGEIRRMLGALRSGPDLGAAGPAGGYRPAPGLAALPDLVRELGEAGVRVDVREECPTAAPEPLPMSVDLAAYRITQEALTNVLRHAPGAHAEVVVRRRPGALDLRIVDDGPGVTPGPSDHRGLGLVGMRERVHAFGGSLRTGPRQDARGFAVEAHLPYGADAVDQPRGEPSAGAS